MKLTTLNNAELVIQARNEADYEEAKKVAEWMQEDSNSWVVMCSDDEYEMWIHMTVVWDYKQAEDLNDLYKAAKKAVK